METINDVISRKETAAFLGICLTTLDRLDIPKTKIRHRVLYKRVEIDKWIDKHTEHSKRGQV
jgi:predicted DNA-binding transcriptional regulator AlpA